MYINITWWLLNYILFSIYDAHWYHKPFYISDFLLSSAHRNSPVSFYLNLFNIFIS